MRFPKMLLFIAFVVAIALSVLYGQQTEGFLDAGAGIAIGVTIVGVLFVGFLVFGLKPETGLNLNKLKLN